MKNQVVFEKFFEKFLEIFNEGKRTKGGRSTRPPSRRHTPCTNSRIPQRPPYTYRKGDTSLRRCSLYARLPFRKCGISYFPSFYPPICTTELFPRIFLY